LFAFRSGIGHQVPQRIENSKRSDLLISGFTHHLEKSKNVKVIVIWGTQMPEKEEYPPRCRNSGLRMNLAASLPRSADLPEVQGFICRPCKRQLTVEIDEEEP
jgi:hypothetical protein